MKNLILVDLGSMDNATTFEFDQFPRTRKELINELIERGQSNATFEGKSLTLMERLLTLDLDGAEIPQDLTTMTISINPMKKMKAGSGVDYTEALAMIPTEDDGYHSVIRSLRSIRNWAEDNDQSDCQELFVDLLPTTTKADLMTILRNTCEFIESKLATPTVSTPATGNAQIEALEKVDAELNGLIVDLTARVTALELRAGIVTNVDEYMKTLEDRFAVVKKHYGN